MTKEITKAIILQQMQDKFKLRDFEPEKFLFSEMVLPTYDIASHVESHLANYVEKSVTSATSFKFFEVPDTERWHLSRYVVVFMGAGAYTVTGVYIRRGKRELASSPIYLDMTAGQTVSYMNDLPKPTILEDGDTLNILVDGYTSTQALRLYIDYTMEQVR